MAAQPDPALGQTGKAAACGACSLRPAQPAETPGCHFLQRPQGSLVRTRGRADACRSDLRSGPTATASQLRAAPSHPHPSCPDHCPLPWQRKLFLCPHLQAPHTLIRRVEPDARRQNAVERGQEAATLLTHLWRRLPGARPPPRSCLLQPLAVTTRAASPAQPCGGHPFPKVSLPGQPSARSPP